MKNLKNLRKNTRNDYLNNLSLNLNDSSNDLDDILSIDIDIIEESILSIFKSYGNINEKRDENLNYINNSNKSEEEVNDYKSIEKTKIFGTSKADKKNENFKYKNDKNLDNPLLKDNWQFNNFLNNQTNLEDFPFSNSNGKMQFENMNQKGIFSFEK